VATAVADDGTNTTITAGGVTVVLQDFSGDDFGFGTFTTLDDINMVSSGNYGYDAVIF